MDPTQAPAELIATCLARHGIAGPVGIAVSGGGDSVALLVLSAEVLGAARIRAATVDHGLRPAAAAEAEGVATLCARLGVAHRVLRWDGSAARGNLMDAARRARLDLLGGWARAEGLTAVLLGHTLEDQAETVLMRLARGSGVDGMAGMAEARRARGILWLRPFLQVSRSKLRDELRQRGVGWVDDPTNDDPRFARSRARNALALLAPLGITAGGLARTADRMARARNALDLAETRARARLVRDDRGTAVLDPAALALPEEVRDRVFAALIGAIAGAAYRPRLSALNRAIDIVAAPGGTATLSGVVLCNDGASIRLWREGKAVATMRCPAGQTWDRRWHANGPRGDSAEIAALGSSGLTLLSRQAGAGLHPHWRDTGLPAAALRGLPAIWRGETLIAAPLHLWPQGWRLVARPLAAWRGHPGESD